MPSVSNSRDSSSRAAAYSGRRASTSFVMVLVFLGVLMISLPAQATDLNGTWSASSLRVSWAIGDWGDACGPRPSGGGERAGQVQLTAEGGGFRLTGLGRSYSTTQCWEQMPGLTTRNRSAGASTISATCSMPSGDPRQARVVTSWYPRGDEIYFDETGQYQFVVSGSNCTASVRRTRILTRVVEASPAEAADESPNSNSTSNDEQQTGAKPSTAPPPLPQRSAQCKSPGRATQVEVTPRTKLMRQGESFRFQVDARDADGCRVPIPATWKLISGKGAELSNSGELRVEENAPTGDLKLELQTYDQRLSVTARVVTDSEYEKLIAGGDFGILGESTETAVTELSSSHVELDSSTPIEERPTNRWWLALVGGLLIALITIAVLLMRRSANIANQKRKKSRVREVLPDPPSNSAVTEAAPEAGAADSPPAPPAEETDPVAAPIPPTTTTSRLCPVCGKRYDDGTAFCGEDGARLMRAN